MKFLLFAASLQKNSVNKKLIHLTADTLTKTGNSIDLADFSEFEMPLYNADIQNHQGFPPVVPQFIERMNQTDGLIISSPEYNYSMPGTLKNLIDWVSRISPMPWRGKKIFLMSASPALVGGNRGLWATRVPLECCGAQVFPDMFSLASAHEAFEVDGQMKDKKLFERLEGMLREYVGMVAKLKS